MRRLPPWAWWTAGAVVLGGGALTLLAHSGPAALPVRTPGLRYVTARPVPLVPGTTYYGRADLGFVLRLLVSPDAVSAKLSSLGFSAILIATDPKELPVSWPASERVGNLFVEATYGGRATTLALPADVAAVWTQ